jgi:hypothetical protein
MIESSVTKQPKIKGGILFLSSNILKGGTGVLAHKFQQEPGLKSSRAPFGMYLSKGQLMNERSAASCAVCLFLRLDSFGRRRSSVKYFARL